jgi:hypothetical protein
VEVDVDVEGAHSHPYSKWVTGPMSAAYDAVDREDFRLLEAADAGVRDGPVRPSIGPL